MVAAKTSSMALKAPATTTSLMKAVTSMITATTASPLAILGGRKRSELPKQPAEEAADAASDRHEENEHDQRNEERSPRRGIASVLHPHQFADVGLPNLPEGQRDQAADHGHHPQNAPRPFANRPLKGDGR